MDLLEHAKRQWSTLQELVEVSPGSTVPLLSRRLDVPQPGHGDAFPRVSSHAAAETLHELTRRVRFGIYHINRILHRRRQDEQMEQHCVSCRRRVRCTCLQWGLRCSVCSQLFCICCFGTSAWRRCFGRVACKRCEMLVIHQRIFHSRLLAMLERGIHCEVTRPSGVKDRAWFHLDVDRSELVWRSFQLMNNLPLFREVLPLSDVTRIAAEGHRLCFFTADRREPVSYDALLEPRETANCLLGSCDNFVVNLKPEDEMISDGATAIISQQGLQVQHKPFVLLKFDNHAKCTEWQEATRIAWLVLAPEQERRRAKQLQSLSRRTADGSPRQSVTDSASGMQPTSELAEVA